jgi:ssDNA-binding Zn-finger/Zn-ribbon topoisomerase 1
MKSRTCVVCREKRKLLKDERICPDCQWLRKYGEGLKKRKPKGSFWTISGDLARRTAELEKER